MKKILLLITLLCLLCASACNLGDETVTTDTDVTSEVTSAEDSVTTTEATTTTAQQDSGSMTTSNAETETDYEYDEGIYDDKEWYSPSLDNENGKEVSNVNVAIAIAKSEFKKIQERGIGASYVFKGAFFDTEDQMWIVWFAEPDLKPGACYNIAISKATGKVLNTWPSE